jgi:hypothetical protein
VAVTAQRGRLVLFCLSAGLLVLAAILFSGGGHASRSVSSSLPSPPHSRGERQVGAIASALRADARRFLAAFFRYETGEEDRSVRMALGATATPAFGSELLAAPPRVVGRKLPPARLERLAITVIPVSSPRALISGEAIRGLRQEQFSFLFDLRRGTWLARGLAE